jgi:hypothetical protein
MLMDECEKRKKENGVMKTKAKKVITNDDIHRHCKFSNGWGAIRKYWLMEMRRLDGRYE